MHISHQVNSDVRLPRRVLSRWRIWLLAVMLFMGWVATVSAASMPMYSITPDTPPLKNFLVHFHLDKTQQLTVEQVAALANTSVVGSSRQIYQANHHYWFGFRLHNASNEPVTRILAFDESFLYRADLYTFHHQAWSREANGLVVPLSQRPTLSQLPAFSVTLAPGETQSFYLFAQAKSSEANVGLTIIDRSLFISQQRIALIFYAMFIGALAALVLYNLFLFLSLRDISYFYYVGHTAFFLVFFIAFSGFDLLLDVSAQTHFQLFAIAVIGTGFLLLFTRSLLQTAQWHRLIDRLLRWGAFAFFALAMLAFINIEFYAYAVWLTLPAMVIQVWVGVLALKQRLPIARYYVFGIGWYIVGMFMLAAQSTGWLPYNELTRYGFLVGTLFEVLLFSLALAYRVKLLQQQRDAYQAELIAQQKSENERLEQLVVERTSELAKLNRELALLAQRDGLTGLYNRRYFDKAIRQAWQFAQRRQENLCLILCDIDYFKAYNDSLGHQAGDECIQRVVQAMLTEFRQDVEVVARYGGEEFAIVARHCDTALVRQMAEQARMAIVDMRLAHPKSPLGYVTVSFGLACQQASDITVESLIYAADQALYRSKALGRNRVTVSD